MSKEPSRAGKTDEALHRSEEMLRALNAAAVAIQRAARTPEAVFEAVGRELERLGFDSIIVLLDEEKHRFVVRHVTLGSETLAAARKLLGGKLVGYTFPVEQMDLYRRVMEIGQTVFDPQPAQSFPQALPESLRKLVTPITRATSHMRNISAPLTVGGERVGILTVSAATLIQEDIPAITAFADQISAALENAQLYEQVERQGREVVAINAIVQALNASLSVKDVFGAVARELGNLVVFDRASIALGSADRQSFTMYALAPAGQPDAPLGEGVTMPVTATAAGPDVMAGRPHLTPDLSTEIDYPGERLLYEAGLRSRVNVPLQISDQVIGALNLASTQPAAFSEHHLSLLQHVAGAIAAAVQNAQLYEQVQVSEARYRHLVENVHDLIFEVDTAGVFTYCSPSIEALMGYASDEMIGRSFVEFMHPDDLPVLWESFERTLERGAWKRIDFRVLAKDGRVVWVRSLGRQVVRDDEVVGLTGVASDITARKQAEMALQRRNEQLAALHETALDLAAQRALPDLLQAIAARAVDLLAAKSGAILLYRPQTDDLAVAFEYNPAVSRIGMISRRGEGLAGRILETGEPLAVDDYSSWEGGSPEYYVEPGIGPDVLAGVPIRWGDRLLGMLAVGDDPPRTFTPADVALLERLSPLVAAALEQARLLDEARRRATELGILYEVTTAATTSVHLDTALDSTIHALRHALETDNISIQLVEPETGDLIVQVAIGFSSDGSPLVGQRVPAGVGIIGRVIQTGQPVLSPDVREDNRYQEYDPDTLSELCVPLRVGSRIIGVLDLESHQVGAFTESDLHLVSTLASNLATIIENARLIQETRHRAETLAALHETALDLAAQRALPDLLQAIVARAVDLLAAKGGGIYNYRPETDDLEFVLSYRLAVDYTGTVLQRGEGLSGWILGTGESLAVDDYSSWGGQAAQYEGGHFAATVGVPIRWGDRFLGVLNVLDDAPRKFSPADVALLERFAPLAAAALEQARLLDEAQRRAAELGILYDVITAATTSAYLDEVLNQTMDALRQALRVDGIAILLVEPETGDLINRVASGFPDVSSLIGRRVDAGLGIVGWVAQTGQPALVPDVRENGRYQEYDPDTLSELCVPLRVRSRTIGVLNLESHQLGAFTESDLSLVSTLAGNLATVIDNAWLVQTLRESEEKYRTLVKTSPEAVTATDLEGCITDLSQQALELHRAKRIEELLGKSALDLIAPEDRDRAMINVQKTLKEGLVRNVEYTMLRKDGSRFTGELSAALIKDASGNPQAFIATVRDVTERKRLEAQLRQAQKMEAIGTLAGGIAHDFNNLLGGILGFASLMERDLPADSPLRTPVETIISAARRGAELTNQLLAFARGGRYEVFPTSLNDVTREVVRLLSRTVDKAIAIEPRLAEDLALVEGDAGQLHQMILNLCLNACDAMPAGGQLTIATANMTLSAEDARAQMELEPGPYVRLRVTDTGIGMDAETMQHIFEPFFTTKKGRPGKQHSGLGLSMVYGIVRSHGGAIRVHSELGQGSTFEVYLPAIERPATVTAVPTTEAAAGSETVLVVDDEDFIRELLQQALKGAGYTVLLAEDGPQALEIYRQRGQDIDLVVLDMGLPQLSGQETFRQLRGIDPQAAVLISSGYAEDDRARAVLDAGARGFLAKPYDLDELLHKIRQVLDRET